MKKITYTFVIIIVVFCLNINVKACSASDGCTNCGSSAAETACKQSDAYKQQNQATSCEDKCNSISNATAKEQCFAGCRQSSGNSGASNSNSGNNSAGNNGSLPSAGAGTILGGSGNNATSSGTNNEIHNVEQTVTGKDNNDDDLGLSIKDYAFAIMNQNADEVKKATKSFGKRLIVAVIILVMPTIINFILEELLEIEQCI